MKKILIVLTVILNCTLLMAQTEFDAFKMVQTDINGTARYMSMAGAFGALGGDASAIKDNPAGLGIYRRSEFSGTLNTLIQKSTSNWNGVSQLDDMLKVGFNNFSYVIATPTWNSENGTTGLLSSNFSFAYNRLKNFNRSLNVIGGQTGSSMTKYMEFFTNGISENNLSSSSSYEPFNNSNVPWLSVLAYGGYLINPAGGTNDWKSFLNDNENVTPGFQLYEKGFQDEYSVAWAGNISNTFYIGASLNYQTLKYSAITDYSESFGDGGGMSLKDTISTKGSGFNLKIGTIIAPIDFLRIGFSLQTPTILTLSDTYYSKLNYDARTNYGYITTPGAYSDYQIQSPLQVSASAAFLVGKKGLISVEYDYTNYTGTRLRSTDGDAHSFKNENTHANQMLNDVGTIKIGGEYRLDENFSLRAGFANSSSANKESAAKLVNENTLRTDFEYFLNNKTNYLTAGFGYHEADWFIDFAYVNKVVEESFYPYNSNNLTTAVNPANIKTSNNNIAVTVGFKF